MRVFKKAAILTLLSCMLCLFLQPIQANAFTRPGTYDSMIPGFDDLTEYEQYLQTADLPDGFVMPQELEPIGTFHQWLDDTRRNQPDNSAYFYRINLHGCDEKLLIYIQHDQAHTYSCMRMSMECLGNDMRTLSDIAPVGPSTFSVILRGNLMFFYSGRELYDIHWNTQYATFEIPSYSAIFKDDFTYAPDSFIGKLFSLDEEKFNEAQEILLSLGTVSAGDPEDSPSTGDPAILFAALLPASVIGIIVLSKKETYMI